MWIQKLGCSTKFTIAVGLILTVAALMGMLSATGVRSIQQRLEGDLQSKLDLVPLIAKLENSQDSDRNKAAELAQIRSLAELDIQTHGHVIDLARGVHRVAFYGTIVVAAFGIGILLLTRRLLFGRLRICFDAIHRIGQKDYSQRCELACLDEIGRIGAALNELMASMGQQKQEMEKAAQRERELLQEQAEKERLAMVAERQREAEETRKEQERQEQQHQREREFAEQETRRHEEEEARATELREKINLLLETVCAVAEGDLRSKGMMKGTSLVDELAAGVGIMVKDLADLIREVAENADHFDGAARIFSENSQVLAEGVVEQMDNISEIRNSADELRKIVGDVMESAATAQEVTRRTEATSLRHLTDRFTLPDEDEKVVSETGEKLQPCWVYKQCGREPGGAKVHEMGVCPAYPNHGYACAGIAGTYCGGRIQGKFSEKLANCMECDYYQSNHYTGERTREKGCAKATRSGQQAD